ncbi:MAG: Asp-tRNA(Asn)/Glu-tRNA(Gln) amidotransferase subunit GatC [Rickettsiaceae bacterium]
MINDIELKKLQILSKIQLSQEELRPFTQKLTSVMNMIDQLLDVQCNNVQPLRSVFETSQRMRQDNIEVTNIAEDLFKNIPAYEANLAKEIKCFIVPKVVE